MNTETLLIGWPGPTTTLSYQAQSPTRFHGLLTAPRSEGVVRSVRFSEQEQLTQPTDFQAFWSEFSWAHVAREVGRAKPHAPFQVVRGKVVPVGLQLAFPTLCVGQWVTVEVSGAFDWIALVGVHVP